MQAKVTWTEDLSFTGTAETGFEVSLDASSQVGGDDEGFIPMELIAIGLAGCTAMDVISILRKKRQEIHAFEVQIQAERAQEHPKVFTAIKITYLIKGRDVSEQAVERAIELSDTKYCPGQAMFRQVAPITLEYQIAEA